MRGDWGQIRRIQSQMVRVAKHLLEHDTCTINLATQGERLDVPERTWSERSLSSGKAIHSGGRVIPHHRCILNESSPDRLQRGDPARICWADEIQLVHQQEGSVEIGT